VVALAWKLAQTRLKVTLGGAIIKFWKQRLTSDDQHFTFQQLSDFVESHGDWRPNSPGRVLELLKAENKINYEVVEANYKNRRNSLYRALPVVKKTPQLPNAGRGGW
jgi:exoribonuclease II